MYPRRLRYNRTNPYVAPGGYENLSSGLESFETRQCATGIRALLDPADAGAFPGDLFARLQQYAFAGETDSSPISRPRQPLATASRSSSGSSTIRIVASPPHPVSSGIRARYNTMM